MRPLVIIKSCHRHGDRRAAVCGTWLRDLKWDRMFAVGNLPPGAGKFHEANTLVFPVSDEFKNIAPKVAAALAWGIKHNFSPFFICDDDTYVVPSRLIAWPSTCGEPADYRGWFRPDGGHGYPLPYIQGSAFWLSRKAAELVASSPEMVDGVPDDVAVGRALWEKVAFTHDPAFHPGPLPELTSERITTHKCLPETMRAIHGALQHSH